MSTPTNKIKTHLDSLTAALSKDTLDKADFNELKEWLQALRTSELRDAREGNFRDHLMDDFKASLAAAGIHEGKICEIGGPYNSFADKMPDFDFEFLSLYPDKNYDNIIVADATQCDYVPSDTYDAIYSVSVFEHISKPWKAAEHLTRILKPGGLMYHAAPFSYFYHGAPADFWRFTPDALETIFSSLRTEKAEFFGRNRRRDNRGSDMNRVDRDGGPLFAVDAFGGWRENWYSIYAGIKDADHLAGKLETARKQVVVNLMKITTMQGIPDAEAIRKVHSVIQEYSVNHDQELTKVSKASSNLKFTLKELKTIWSTRSKKTVMPSYNRFTMARFTGIS